MSSSDGPVHAAQARRQSKPQRAGSDLNAEELEAAMGLFPHAVRQQIVTVKQGLKRRQLSGAHPCAKATVEVLRNVLGNGGFRNAKEMLQAVRIVGKELGSVAPAELTVGNITRRVMYMIRDEYNGKRRAATAPTASDSGIGAGAASQRQRSTSTERVESGLSPLLFPPPAPAPAPAPASSPAPSPSPSPTTPPSLGRRPLSSSSSFASLALGSKDLQSLSLSSSSHDRDSQQPSLTRTLSMQTEVAEDYTTVYGDLRQAVMGAVNELNDEIDNVYSPICAQAEDHIHHDECVLASGWSYMVEHFLKAAARKRRYHVVICESAPALDGHKLAAAIGHLPNISVTLIPDSAVYAIMSRINKVVFSPQAVMADGGAICTAGQLNIQVAAKEHHVPTVGLTGAFLLTPMFAHNQRAALGQLLSPASIVNYNLAVCQEHVEVVNPSFEYVPPDLVDVYVTNNGTHQPSYMYRLLTEYYNREDYVL